MNGQDQADQWIVRLERWMNFLIRALGSWWVFGVVIAITCVILAVVLLGGAP